MRGIIRSEITSSGRQDLAFSQPSWPSSATMTSYSGERISAALRVSGEFPLDAVDMVAVGEESGDLDGVLNKLVDFYNKETSYTIKRLTTLIEPLFLAVIGGIVGFIMLSVLLPIFEMVKILR